MPTLPIKMLFPQTPCVVGLLWLLIFPLYAYAGTDVTQVLNNLLHYLTGPLGVTLSTLAIVTLGFGCFKIGTVPKSAFFSVVVGIGLIFGASSLIATLGVSS